MVTKVYYALANSNTWVDSSTQGLFVGKYDFPYPDVKTMAVDIPALDGVIDLTETLQGEPIYKNVVGTIRFIVLVGATFDIDDFINTYHGQRIKFYTDDDITHYRTGRATITKDDHYRILRSFTITVDAEPYSWSMNEISRNYSITTTSTAPTLTKVKGYGDNGDYDSANNRVSVSNMSSGPMVNTIGARYSMPVQSDSLYTFSAVLPDDISAYYKVYLPDETPVDAMGFETGNNTSVYVEFWITGVFSSMFQKYYFTNLALVRATTTLTINARKTTVPTLKSTKACTAIVNGDVMQLAANEEKPNFSILLNGGTNRMVFIGSTSGTVTLKYREGVLV